MIKLEKLALNEEWEKIDNYIAKSIKLKFFSKYHRWAQLCLTSDNDDIRDLGVSVLEKAIISNKAFKLNYASNLFNLMNHDSHSYVRFRSAFALTNHGVFGENALEPKKVYNEKLETTLKEAVRDNDVKEIASKYLRMLPNM